jgi:hypothetical protein
VRSGQEPGNHGDLRSAAARGIPSRHRLQAALEAARLSGIMTAMGRVQAGFGGWVMAVLLGFTAPQAAAMIFYASGDPDYHTTAPTGSLTNSGWQWQGNWRGFGGTPIGTNLFLTAKHVGGSVGDTFTFDGQDYRTVAYFPDAISDLMIWQVCGTFPRFAPLYTGPPEIYLSCVVFGRGFPRGAEVTITNNSQVALRGWAWGPGAGRLRWGQNKITEMIKNSDGSDLLKVPFDANGGPDVAALASGDSGGAVFIQSSGWRLAGINLAVDGPFSYVASGPGFFAALFEKSGLYEESGSSWPSALSGPSAFYATRVSSRQSWIKNIIAQHDGRQPAPTLEAAPDVSGPFVAATNAVVNASAQTITVPVPGKSQFYRLNGCVNVSVSGIRVSNGVIVLTWRIGN